jgi:hypothetical protein
MLANHSGLQKGTLHTPGEVLISCTGFEMLQRFAVMIASSDDAIMQNDRRHSHELEYRS